MSLGGVTLKRGNSEKSVPTCCFVHHKWHMDWPGREAVLLRLEICCLNAGRILIIFGYVGMISDDPIYCL
jgi:hypothetical protein